MITEAIRGMAVYPLNDAGLSDVALTLSPCDAGIFHPHLVSPPDGGVADFSFFKD